MQENGLMKSPKAPGLQPATKKKRMMEEEEEDDMLTQSPVKKSKLSRSNLKRKKTVTVASKTVLTDTQKLLAASEEKVKELELKLGNLVSFFHSFIDIFVNNNCINHNRIFHLMNTKACAR